jgi:hypothetical protein
MELAVARRFLTGVIVVVDEMVAVSVMTETTVTVASSVT